MPAWNLPPESVDRLHAQSGAARWGVTREAFALALERSARRAFAEAPEADVLVRYSRGLRLEDLALACACAAGVEAAWDHFVREFRPVLYRAADSLDPTGGARDLADGLYADLFGLGERGGQRRSLFDYFHGRSGLATWLRAVLAQRRIDRVRHQWRSVALADDDPREPSVPGAEETAGDRRRYLVALRAALQAAVPRLPDRDRLRLSCYYAEGLTLAQIGRALGEHEATVSRHLARARRTVQQEVERELRETHNMSGPEIAACFASVIEDAGPLDMAELLGPPRKKLEEERSR